MTKNRFRAWDKSFQKYCENVIVSTINGKITVYGRLVNGNTALIPSTHVVLEQCTGLKDKNGRLIYEGDIIQHDTAAGPKCWPVVFKNGCFVLPYESGEAWLGKVIEHCPYDSGVVIAGNIHENPELLEANNDNKN